MFSEIQSNVKKRKQNSRIAVRSHSLPRQVCILKADYNTIHPALGEKRTLLFPQFFHDLIIQNNKVIFEFSVYSFQEIFKYFYSKNILNSEIITKLL